MDVSKLKNDLRTFYFMLYPRKAMIFPTLRSYLAQSRFFLYGRMWSRFLFFMVKNRGKITTLPTKIGEHLNSVIYHNFQENFNLMSFSRGRVESILYPLMSISSVRRNAKNLKVLSIGPKNEGELLLLKGQGFKWENITGIDLFSYSPKIKVMDMHNMNFPDNTFDVIICSRVLSYSDGDEVKNAIKEIIRVAKPGAIAAIGIAWNIKDDRDKEYSSNRFDGWLDELFGYFTGHIDCVYWRSEEKKEGGLGDMTTVFRIKK